MKYIEKGSEPQSLLDWKDQDKMFQRKKAKWKRFGRPYKQNFIFDLAKEQGFICCYCEQRLDISDSHIEHLIPQKLDEFSEYLFDYNNLLCSCQLKLEAGEPRHCGNSKGSQVLPITPLKADCESKFKYTADGHILGICDDAKRTIEILQLDIEKLRDLRKNAIEPFIIDPETLDPISPEESKKFAEAYLQIVDGCYNEFYTTIKYLFSK